VRFISASQYTDGHRKLLFGICDPARLAPPARRYGRRGVQEDSDRQQLDSLWQDVQRRLRASVPDSTFNLWLGPLRVLGAQGRTLHLSAPDSIRSWVERRYAALIGEALAAAGSALSEVSFAPIEAAAADDGLNPSYTFERFVIGEGNRFAHAAALAVAEAPSEAYNPLFLHGPPGLGKTHLLVAVAHYLADNGPQLSVRYTTAECFTNEFVEALRTKGGEAFKHRYRDLDVLLVDDVQFLEGKPNTEEEFFHTFNALHEGGSQIALSSDRSPSQLSTLAERLRDRFEWGLAVAVESPNLATRLTVLRRLVREAGLSEAGGEEEALVELAGRINLNVRQLHGALTRVIAHASLTSRPLEPKLIAELIPRSEPARGEAPVEEIQQRVASSFGVSRAELVGSSRASAPLRARQIAILLTREATALSLPQIGRLYGGRDHSTVLNALRRIKASIDKDPDLADKVDRLRSEIHNLPTNLR
jgi:chromosomal replication initiator protein